MSQTPGRGAATLSLLGAAFGFSTIAIFTTLLDRAGVSLLPAMTVRYAVASLLLVPLAGGVPAMRLAPRKVAELAIIGGTGQSLIAYLSLSALDYIPAATLVFLFYTFPAWVALRAAVMRTEPLSGQRWLSLALSFGGVGVMVGWPGTSINPLGAGLALSAAVVYALFIPLINRLQAGAGPVVSTAWVALGATVLFGAGTLATGQFSFPAATLPWLWMVGLGVVSTAMAFTLFLRGLQVLGPVHTAIVTTAEPFFVSALAALVLDQPITVQTIAGGTLIAAAVLILQRSPR